MVHRTQGIAKRPGLIALAILTAIGPTTPAVAWADDYAEVPHETVGEPAPDDNSGDQERGGGFGIHFQTGAFWRLDWLSNDTYTKRWLVTADLAGLFGDSQQARWGLGIHLAYDERLRLGAKWQWRAPLTGKALSYLQISPGIYLYADDDDHNRYEYTVTRTQAQTEFFKRVGKLDLPAFFCEVELGFSNKFALVTALECLPFDWTIYDSGSEVTPIGHEEKLDWNWYVGLKFGQGVAVAATFAAAVMLGIATALAPELNLSGMQMSGWDLY